MNTTTSTTFAVRSPQAGEGEHNTHVRIFASYQLMSDMGPEEWAEAQFGWAQEQGLIEGWNLLNCSHLGWVWGLLFWVDIPFTEGGSMTPNMDHQTATFRAENLLNGTIIHDSDVEVVYVAGVKRDAHPERMYPASHYDESGRLLLRGERG